MLDIRTLPELCRFHRAKSKYYGSNVDRKEQDYPTELPLVVALEPSVCMFLITHMSKYLVYKIETSVHGQLTAACPPATIQLN